MKTFPYSRHVCRDSVLHDENEKWGIESRIGGEFAGRQMGGVWLGLGSALHQGEGEVNRRSRKGQDAVTAGVYPREKGPVMGYTQRRHQSQSHPGCMARGSCSMQWDGWWAVFPLGA